MWGREWLREGMCEREMSYGDIGRVKKVMGGKAS